MSSINNILYRPATRNLQTKIVVYRDQEKLLKQVEGS